MQSFLLTLGYGVGALLAVAIGVAWWEHLRHKYLLKDERSVFTSPPARTVAVDVDLDALPAAALSQDQSERQASVEVAMARMSRSAGTPGAAPWTETRPMVGPGVTRETAAG